VKVRRRVEPADFKEAYELMQRPRGRALWSVCDEYEIQGDKIVATIRFSNISEEWTDYAPLEDVPDLFLKFSRIYREDSFEEAALAFSHNYGLPSSDQEIVASEIDIDGAVEKISLSRFREEARKAHCVLTLYEAVLNEDAQAAKKIFQEHRAIRLFALYDEFFRIENLHDPYGLLHISLLCAIETVQEIVHKLCRQHIRIDVQMDRVPDLSTAKMFWDFDDLLGAMYLQMWGLMASGGNIARCEYCGRIISLARPHPEGRKRRRDKKFCDDACRQAHHRSKSKSQTQ
jgi:hypothetical protein